MMFHKVKSTLLILTILSSILLVSCADSGDAPAVTNNDTSPNIILIIADDLGWDAFGNYPGITSTKANTPTIDSLAQNGVTFTNFWSNPVCAPTRAALLTGKYGFRTGVGGAQSPQTATLANTETTIQKYISDNTLDAYTSGVIGKWHISGSTDLNAPENFGIDYFSGFLRGTVPDYYNWTQTSAGIQTDVTTYSTTHFVDQSIDWIDQQSKPFFLWLAFNAPHTPFHRPPLNLISDQSLSSNQATIDSNPLPYYLASIEAMDTEIARLIGSLTDDQKENTIFIFLGDNGTPSQVAQQPFSSSAAKNTLYQGGVNVPLIICGKGISRKNETETSLVQVTDLFPTIADLAGTGTTAYEDGVSLKPLLSLSGSNGRTFVYTEQFGNTPSDKDGYTLRNEAFKLIVLENGTELFYQLDLDPFEQDNLLLTTLSAQAQQILDELKAIQSEL